MKTLQLVAVAAALASAVSASAAIDYNIIFTATDGGLTAANGQITVDSGLATGGFLDVTAGPKPGHYVLITSGGSGAFTWDNMVSSSAPFITTTGGLLWGSSQGEMNMWYNSVAFQWQSFTAPADTYSLWGSNPNYSPTAYGNASFSVVPEPSTYFAGIGALGMLWFFGRGKQK
jgi:hypothetical protein